PRPAAAVDLGALFRLRLRYKQPDGTTSRLLEQDVADAGTGFAGTSRDFQWTSAVAAFGMLLRGSPHLGNSTWDSVLEIAGAARGDDPARAEFLKLVELAKRLARRGC
ncbi:MAG: YfbK domain-containing protein, partial [Planctomycetota bacterium]